MLTALVLLWSIGTRINPSAWVYFATASLTSREFKHRLGSTRRPVVIRRRGERDRYDGRRSDGRSAFRAAAHPD